MLNKLKLYLDKEENIYIMSITLLVLAFIWSTTSYYLDVYKVKDGTFFQRSGAILVLVGVMVEYALSNISSVDKCSDVFINNKPVETKRLMTEKYNYIKYTAHIYIVVGTFIWGYIDCIWGCS